MEIVLIVKNRANENIILSLRSSALSSPAIHIAQGIGSTAVLYPFIGENAYVFGLSVILIDIDHVIQYADDTKNMSPKGFFVYNDFLDHNLFNGNIDRDYLCINLFHTFECYLLLLFFASSFPVLYYVLFGFLFHHLFDQIYLIKKKIPFIRAFSIPEYFIRKKNKITSMREILEIEKVHTLEFPDLDKWIVKWGMKEA
jgi:hypothetical protein